MTHAVSTDLVTGLATGLVTGLATSLARAVLLAAATTAALATASRLPIGSELLRLILARSVTRIGQWLAGCRCAPIRLSMFWPARLRLAPATRRVVAGRFARRRIPVNVLGLVLVRLGLAGRVG